LLFSSLFPTDHFQKSQRKINSFLFRILQIKLKSKNDKSRNNENEMSPLVICRVDSRFVPLEHYSREIEQKKNKQTKKQNRKMNDKRHAHSRAHGVALSADKFWGGSFSLRNIRPQQRMKMHNRRGEALTLDWLLEGS
jgi:hypothetical protein